MSDALAISAVSFVLQHYLWSIYSGLTTEFGGVVHVSALAPDIVQNQLTSSTAPQSRVNLFLHQVTPNPNWRNVGLPSLASDGATRLKNPPLALDLHYLLTAYGSENWHAEGLLGYALLMLHQNPVIARADITAAFEALTTFHSNNPLAPFLGSSGLADQLEMIKITPATLGREEMAWLWTALKADYRPTFPFQVSVVLMTTPAQTTFAFPVMTRNLSAVPLSFAQLQQITLPSPDTTAAISGDTVVITGVALANVTQVALTNVRLGIRQIIPIPKAAVTSTSISFQVPADTAANPMPAGMYSVTAQSIDPAGNMQTTNSLAMAVAPVIDTATVEPPTPTSTTINVTCKPNVLSRQSVAFILNPMSAPAPGASAPAQPFTGTTTSLLTFQFTPAPAAGTYIMCLQVDGVVSAITWNNPPPPATPSFTGPTVTL